MSADSSSKSSNDNCGWRACFDFCDLNTMTSEKPKVQLPTISEVQKMSYNKLATIVDITNMFWSINIHKDSQKFNNFYLNKHIYRHA